jgi:hypothetical protein
MPFALFRRTTKEDARDGSVDDLAQILVRLGKLSPFALGAMMMAMSKSSADEELVQQLVQRKLVSQQDIEVARQVQEKLRAGQPIYEEWAKLEAIMAENKRCSQELTAVITERKDRRRKRGEDTVMFLTPRHFRSAT